MRQRTVPYTVVCEINSWHYTVQVMAYDKDDAELRGLKKTVLAYLAEYHPNWDTEVAHALRASCPKTLYDLWACEDLMSLLTIKGHPEVYCTGRKIKNNLVLGIGKPKRYPFTEWEIKCKISHIP